MPEIADLAHFELAPAYYAVLFVVAVFAGFIDAIVGGSGLITLPALLLCGVPPHLSLATNKLQSTCGSLTAAVLYFKSRTLPHLALGCALSAVGAGAGALTALLIHAENLKFLILIFLVLTFFYMALRPNLGRERGLPKIKNVKIFHFLIAFPVGFYDGFLGPGTGSFLIFACVSLLGYNLKEASINTKFLNFSSNIVALATFLILYQALWSLGLLMAAGQIVGAFFGSKLVLKTQARFIKALFLVVVGATICKLAWDFF